MHDDVLLDIAARADADRLVVATQDRAEPDADARAETDIADDHRIRRDPDVLLVGEIGRDTIERVKRQWKGSLRANAAKFTPRLP